jgi:hypothetical protein
MFIAIFVYQIKTNTMKNKNAAKNKPVVNMGKIKRGIMLTQGAYDGRFAPKVVNNKKKQASKDACRVKVSV